MFPFLAAAPRHLFFTGKGGVGKTSIACASAVALAERGRRVVLISTDPASNLDEVLATALGTTPTAVASVAGLYALNIDPEAAARAHRERVIGPYRGKLPAAYVAQVEEQLSGACMVEIAAFDEFAKLLGDPAATAGFEHVLFDTAPTGHTLRLLSLPSAWSEFVQTNTTGASCIGPLSGLKGQRALYEATVRALADGARTLLVLVARPEASALAEAERTSGELRALGIENQHLAINAVFRPSEGDDPIAAALAERSRAALAAVAPPLADLPRTEVPLRGGALIGVEALRRLLDGDGGTTIESAEPSPAALPTGLTTLIDEIERGGRGVVMTMGKGGVGKTTVAAAIAVELARRGHPVHLTTTDPAAHVARVVGVPPPNLVVSRIDPASETRRYVEEVFATAGAGLDGQGRALLAEDLRSPCTEEVAVFRAFARTVAEGASGFVVIDTAPTGHTILLLDAAEAYHREVSRQGSHMPDEVRQLLPRLRDGRFTRVVLVALPEATPIHEAARLQDDLRRAGVEPFAWVINQCLSPLTIRDRVLRARQVGERRYLDEVTSRLSRNVVVTPWMAAPPTGTAPLQRLIAASPTA